MPLKGKKSSTKVSVDFSGVEDRDYSLPDGDYVLTVTTVEKKTSESSGNEYLSWEYRVAEGKYKGRKVWENTSLQPQALWRLRNLLEAMGAEVPEGEMELDLDDFTDEQVGAHIENEKYQGKDKPRITAYISLSDVEAEGAEPEVEAEPEPTVKTKKKKTPEFEVGQKVSFEDEGKTYSGKITALEADTATVKVGKDAWELSLDELTPE